MLYQHVLNMHPSMYAIFRYVRNILNLLWVRWCVKAPPIKPEPPCSPHALRMITMGFSWSKPPHCPLPSNNYSTSGHFSQWEPQTSDHVTELYNSYIVAKLFQLLPLSKSKSRDLGDMAWFLRHNSTSGSPLLLQECLPHWVYKQAQDLVECAVHWQIYYWHTLSTSPASATRLSGSKSTAR